MLEHLFVGEVMRQLWLERIYDLEVLNPQVDSAGYDLAFERGSIVRHVQLKSARKGARFGYQKVSLDLASKPSGCVVVVEFDERLVLGPFYWFGGTAGAKLPDILSFHTARHTKANAQGEKRERPNIRKVMRSRFERLATIEEVVRRLFLAS
jgi:hypothetical protein